MKHLVLGSSGQIGNHLVKYLLSQGQEVSQFDIVDGYLYDLRKYWTDNQLLYKLMNECDFVHFLAFDVGGSIYLEKYQNTFEFISNNSRIMENTFQLLKELKKPFIFASSQMSNMLHSSYGVLKSLGEYYTRSLNGIIVKFWNIYGEEHDPNKFHVITDFIKSIKHTNEIQMKTTGEEYRQFLYADDCSECLYVLSQKYDLISRDIPLHVTNFEWNTIEEVAKIICHIHTSETGNISKFYKGEKLDAIQQNSRNQPDETILNYWKPKTSLYDGINKLYKVIN